MVIAGACNVPAPPMLCDGSAKYLNNKVDPSQRNLLVRLVPTLKRWHCLRAVPPLPQLARPPPRGLRSLLLLLAALLSLCVRRLAP